MSNNILTVNQYELEGLLDQKDAVRVNMDTWRWGTVETWVVPKDGKFYKFHIRFQTDEGMQEGEEIHGYEVEPKVEMKPITTWIPVTK